MADAKTPTIDLGRLSLSFGEGARLDLDLPLESLELGGQAYEPATSTVPARLDISRPSNGYAFRLRFPLRVEGPCVRCLGAAAVETEVDVREVDQSDTEEEELRSPYVVDGDLEVGRWAQDTALLTLPARILCRADCAGLCPVCGESLNDADPSDHQHGVTTDPRWAKLDELKREQAP
jgi:uncharacterized protein